MVEYAGSRSGFRTQRDEGAALVGVLRSLDWLLVAGIGGLIAVGLWAVKGVTRFDVVDEAPLRIECPEDPVRKR